MMPEPKKTHRVLVARMNEDDHGYSGEPGTHFQADCERMIPDDREAIREPTCRTCLNNIGRIQERP